MLEAWWIGFITVLGVAVIVAITTVLYMLITWLWDMLPERGRTVTQWVICLAVILVVLPLFIGTLVTAA